MLCGRLIPVQQLSESHLLYCVTKWDTSQQHEQQKIMIVGTNLSVAHLQLKYLRNAFGPVKHKEVFVQRVNRNHGESVHILLRKHWN